MATTVILPRTRQRPRPPNPEPAAPTDEPYPNPTTIVQDERVSTTTDSRGEGRTRAVVTNGDSFMQPGWAPRFGRSDRRPSPARQAPRPSRETDFAERAAPVKRLTFGRIILRIFPGGEFELERAGDNKVIKVEMIGSRPTRTDGPTPPPENAGPIRLSIREDLNDLLVALDVAAGEQTVALSPESRREMSGAVPTRSRAR